MKKRLRDKIKLQCKLEGAVYPMCFDCKYYNYFYEIKDEQSCSSRDAIARWGKRTQQENECDKYWHELNDNWAEDFKPSETIKYEILKRELED